MAAISTIYSSLLQRKIEGSLEVTKSEYRRLIELILSSSLGTISLYSFVSKFATIVQVATTPSSRLSVDYGKKSRRKFSVSPIEYYSIYSALKEHVEALSPGLEKTEYIDFSNSILGLYDVGKPTYLPFYLEADAPIIDSTTNIITSKENFLKVNGIAPVPGSYINYTILDTITNKTLYTNRIAAPSSGFTLNITVPILTLSSYRELEVQVSQLLVARGSSQVLDTSSHIYARTSSFHNIVNASGTIVAGATPSSDNAYSIFGIGDNMVMFQGDYSKFLYNGMTLSLAGFTSSNNGVKTLGKYDIFESVNGHYTLLQFSTPLITDSLNGYVTIPLNTISATQAHSSFAPASFMTSLTTPNIFGILSVSIVS